MNNFNLPLLVEVIHNSLMSLRVYLPFLTFIVTEELKKKHTRFVWLPVPAQRCHLAAGCLKYNNNMFHFRVLWVYLPWFECSSLMVKPAVVCMLVLRCITSLCWRTGALSSREQKNLFLIFISQTAIWEDGKTFFYTAARLWLTWVQTKRVSFHFCAGFCREYFNITLIHIVYVNHSIAHTSCCSQCFCQNIQQSARWDWRITVNHYNIYRKSSLWCSVAR